MKEKRLAKLNGYKLLTPERVRQFNGLENLSDQEARKVIDSLEQLSLILFDYLRKSRP